MSNQLILSDSEVQTLVQAGVIPDGTPKAQIAVFAQICKERGLSAFSKEIHLVGYNGRYSVIVGINGFRKIAAETGQHAGTDDVKFDVLPDGSFKTAVQLKAEKILPASATCTVYRIVSGLRVGFTHTVLFSEFSTGKNKWQEMPFQMIGKVAEAFALRKGFSDRLTGLAIEEEAAAMEGSTIQAQQTTKPELSIDLELLKEKIKACASVSDLTRLYGSNPLHEKYVELFTDRKYDLNPELMLAK